MLAALGRCAHGGRAARQGHTWSNAWAAYFPAKTYSTYYDPTPVTGAAPADDMFVYQSMCGPRCGRVWRHFQRGLLFNAGRARAQAAGRRACGHIPWHDARQLLYGDALLPRGTP